MSVNKVILVGFAGKDPEVRYLDNGTGVASFSLATTDRGYTTKDGKVVEEKTEWHNIVAWKGLATIAEKFIKKGSQLLIEGKVTTRTWEKDGVKNYRTEIIADNIELLGGKIGVSENATTKLPEPPKEEIDGTDGFPF